MTMRVYLAGPDVFLREALALAKRELCQRYGFTRVSPIDNVTARRGLELRAPA